LDQTGLKSFTKAKKLAARIQRHYQGELGTAGNVPCKGNEKQMAGGTPWSLTGGIVECFHGKTRGRKKYRAPRLGEVTNRWRKKLERAIMGYHRGVGRGTLFSDKKDSLRKGWLKFALTL